MTSSLRLDVVLWIPIAVKNDTNIRRRQVDSNSTSTRRKEEKEAVVLPFEAINCFLTFRPPNTTVESFVVETTEVTVFGNEVNHLNHLTEDEDFVAFLSQFGKKLVHQYHCRGKLDRLQSRVK